MPRRPKSSLPDLRARLEEARLDNLALIRALDRIPARIPQREVHNLFTLDADCAEALWALDRPPGSFNFEAMVRDTVASLDALPDARQHVRSRIPPPHASKALNIEQAIRVALEPEEAYNDVPGRDPHIR